MLKKKKLLLNLLLLITWVICLGYFSILRFSLSVTWGSVTAGYFCYLFIYIPYKQVTLPLPNLSFNIAIISNEVPAHKLNILYIYWRASYLRPYLIVLTAWGSLYAYINNQGPKKSKLRFIISYTVSLTTIIIFHVALIYLINIWLLVKALFNNDDNAEDLYIRELDNLYPGSAKTPWGYPITDVLIDPNRKLIII